MNTFIRFFYEFMSIFFDGIAMIFKGLYEGIVKMFNFGEYAKLISSYNGNFNGLEKVLVTVCIIVLVLIIVLILFLFIMFIRKMLRSADSRMNKEELLSEIADLKSVFKVYFEGGWSSQWRRGWW